VNRFADVDAGADIIPIPSKDELAPDPEDTTPTADTIPVVPAAANPVDDMPPVANADAVPVDTADVSMLEADEETWSLLGDRGGGGGDLLSR